MRALLAAICVTIICLLMPAFAAEEESPAPQLSGGFPPFAFSAVEEAPHPGVTGSVALRTDYVKTGASQTSNHPAVQGALTWTHRSGFYVTSFISNIDLQPDNPVFAEVDVQGGYGGSFRGFSYSLGVTRYSYPRSRRSGQVAGAASKSAAEPALAAADPPLERLDSLGILPEQITGGHYGFTEFFGSITRPTPLGDITLSVVHSPNNTGYYPKY